VYVFTITDKLSGSYNSAVQGKMLYDEENSDGKKIHIFNSLATAGLETLAVKKTKALADEGKSFEEIIDEVESFIVNNTALYFCLESLDALKANGRLFALAAKVLEKIRVKLICERTVEGNIALAGQDIAINRAVVKMANIITSKLEGKDLSNDELIISYVCCEDRAKLVADKIKEKTNFGTVNVIKASGLNSLYASDGGIIVSYSYR
jgi:DegV family protein with EDD domain